MPNSSHPPTDPLLPDHLPHLGGAEDPTTDRPGPTQLDFEVGLYAAVLEQCPQHSDALRCQAEALARLGRHADALELDERLCAVRPTDPVARYNLACSLCLMGRRQQALGQLQVAVTLGYNDWLHLERDRDLAPLRHEPEFRRLLHRLRPRLR